MNNNNNANNDSNNNEKGRRGYGDITVTTTLLDGIVPVGTIYNITNTMLEDQLIALARRKGVNGINGITIYRNRYFNKATGQKEVSIQAAMVLDAKSTSIDRSISNSNSRISIHTKSRFTFSKELTRFVSLFCDDETIKNNIAREHGNDVYIKLIPQKIVTYFFAVNPNIHDVLVNIDPTDSKDMIARNYCITVIKREKMRNGGAGVKNNFASIARGLRL